MSLTKDLKKVLRQAKKQGWMVKDVGRRYKLYPPKGQMITAAKTPSDQRAIRNLIARMRREGFVWKGR